MFNSFERAAGIYCSYKTHQQSLATALKYAGGHPELLPPVAKTVCAQMGGWRGGGGVKGLKMEQWPKSLAELFRHGKRRASSSGWRQSSATRPLPLPPSRARIKRSSHLHFIINPPGTFISRRPCRDQDRWYADKIDQSKWRHCDSGGSDQDPTMAQTHPYKSLFFI